MAAQDSSKTGSKPAVVPPHGSETANGPPSSHAGKSDAPDNCPNTPPTSSELSEKPLDSGKVHKVKRAESCPFCRRPVPDHGPFCTLFPRPLR